MKLLALLFVLLLGASRDRVTVSTVPCHSVADCWLDREGKPIRRPSAKRDQRLPRGSCGRQLVWLRNRLQCENQVCVAKYIGDAC